MLDQRTLSAGPAAAGWYADPLDPARLRWWDGDSWTARLAATTPSGPTRRGVPDLPSTEDTVPAVPPTRVAFASPDGGTLTKTRELPVITEVPRMSPDRAEGVSLATDPIASLENLFADADDEDDEQADLASDAGGPFPFVAESPLGAAASLAAVPAVAPDVAPPAVAPPALGSASTPTVAPPPGVFGDTDVATFLTDAAGELTLPKRHRAEVEPPAVDPAAFVPGGRRARRHAEALASGTAPSGGIDGTDDSDDRDEPTGTEGSEESAAVSAAETLAALAAAAVPAAPSPAAAAAAAPLIAAAVAPELVEPVLSAALAQPSDTAEIVARINREAREHDEPVKTASLPVTDEPDDDDVDDVPAESVPVVAAALALPVVPSVLPSRPEERTPAFTLPKALATPAAPPTEANPHFEWHAGAEASAPAALVESDELNEFAGVIGPLTPSTRVKLEAEPERWATGAAWTLALAPVLTAGIALGIAVLALTGSINETQTRWYVIGANLVLFAVFLLSAMADRRALKAAGHTRTASEFWLLLSPVAYLIARTVQVRRRLGRGSAPLWVHVGALIALGVAGAGAAMLPQATPDPAESQYEAALEQALAVQGTEVTVTCPADITGTVGATYTCTAVAADGTMLSLGIEMQDEGRFAYTVADAPTQG